MQVIVQVEASSYIGLGHLMRCLTLARQLDVLEIKCLFVVNQHDLNLSQLLYEADFEYKFVDSRSSTFAEVSLVAKNAMTLVIIDNYDFDSEWHHQLKSVDTLIMTIDDLANRHLNPDLLLDQNMAENYQTRYDDLIPKNCISLLGPKYALLREEFYLQRKELPSIETRLNNAMILVNFGGADPDNETLKAAKGVVAFDGVKEIVIVVGSGYLHYELLKAWAKTYPKVALLQNVSNMAHLMSQALVMVGAVGSTTWERCALGCVGLVSAIAENQQATAEYLHKLGIHQFLGCHNELESDDYRRRLESMMANSDELLSMSERAYGLVDGLGAHRVAQKIQEFMMDKYASR
ncbi:MAG: UDP-2,4-diacetamido-2,4,6-trideoxy-beta-L-altropyranose hydrolase [Psychrobium sp.]